MALSKVTPQVVTAQGNRWSARKTAGLVELRISGLYASASETLPAEFTPAAQTYVPVSAQSTTNAYTPRVAVTVTGVLTSQGYTGGAYGIATYRTA